VIFETTVSFRTPAKLNEGDEGNKEMKRMKDELC